MANRFPLVLNTSSNQLQELASGDTLDLTGSGLNLTGITTLSSSAQLNLNGGTNINTGTRGDILFYNSSGTIQKLSLGTSGKILKSNGTDLVYGDSGATTNVYYVAKNGTVITASRVNTEVDATVEKNLNVAWIETAVQNDYFELFVANESGTDDLVVTNGSFRTS
mgnify:CR=1 FL=1